MKRVIIVLIAAASLLLAPSAWAEKVTRYDRFQLWSKCQPMNLDVSGFGEAATNIALTKEAVITAARSRLRAARLYDASAGSYVSVDVRVLSRAFYISVAFVKPMKDLASNESHYNVSWRYFFFGTHGQDSSYVMSAVTRSFDKFIDEYLRVNNDACKR